MSLLAATLIGIINRGSPHTQKLKGKLCTYLLTWGDSSDYCLSIENDNKWQFLTKSKQMKTKSLVKLVLKAFRKQCSFKHNPVTCCWIVLPCGCKDCQFKNMSFHITQGWVRCNTNDKLCCKSCQSYAPKIVKYDVPLSNNSQDQHSILQCVLTEENSTS